MPLIKSKSKAARQKNIETEMDANPSKDSRAQNLAIAYNIQREAKKSKKMARGGRVSEEDEDEKDDEIQDVTPNGFIVDPVSDEEMEQMNQDREKGMAHGGDVEEHYSSIADAILAKKRKNMADGGMVDLQENADEEPNNEDQMSFEALKKENYSESAMLDESQPEDSNEHGHDLSDEDKHDMIDSIRKKLKSKRGM